MGAADPERNRPGELEQLGSELSRRGLHTVLGPDVHDEAALDVVNSHPVGAALSMTAKRVYWREGQYWYEAGFLGADIGDAARALCDALRWTQAASA